MKFRAFLIAAILLQTGFAQWIVNDPVNTTVNLGIQSTQTANHLEVLKNWSDQLTKLNRQIRQLEEQLNEQRRIREVLGNPSLAGSQMAMEALAPEKLAQSYGDTLRQLRRLANATLSLHRTAEGVYRKLDDTTSLQQPFDRHTTPYLRYAAVETQADQTEQVFDNTAERQASLQSDLATTLAKLPSAATQAEVDKLNLKITALNGQLLLLAQERRDEADLLHSQHIQNENQAAKERLDWQEKQVNEERQTLDIVNPWQRSVRLTPTSYTQP